MHREDEHFHVRQVPPQSGGHLQSVETGHLDVHQDDVRAQFLNPKQRFMAIAGLSHDFEPGLASEARPYSLAHHGVIIHQHEPKSILRRAGRPNPAGGDHGDYGFGRARGGSCTRFFRQARAHSG